MASRLYSNEEVLAILDQEEDCELDEVIMEGSDEDFSDLDEVEDGTKYNNNC